ncbi:MAG: hypothetical protein AB7F75_10065 [Planctomycetota bacterium]
MKKLSLAFLTLMLMLAAFVQAKEPSTSNQADDGITDVVPGDEALPEPAPAVMDPAVKAKLDKAFAAVETILRSLATQGQASTATAGGSRSQISVAFNATPPQGQAVTLGLKLNLAIDMAQKKGVAKLEGDLGKVLVQFNPTMAEVVLPDYGMFAKIPMQGDFAKMFSSGEDQIKNLDEMIAKIKSEFFSDPKLAELKSAPEETFGGEPCDVLQCSGEESGKIYISKATGLVRGFSGSDASGSGTFTLDYQNGLPTKLTGEFKGEGKTAGVSAMVEWKDKVVTKCSLQVNFTDAKGTKVMFQMSVKSDVAAIAPEELVLTYKKEEFREASQDEIGQALMMAAMGKFMALLPLMQGMGDESAPMIPPPVPGEEGNEEGF